jgi:hypothetical protein
MVALSNVHLILVIVLGGTVLAALFTEVRVIENVLKGKIDTLSTITFQGDDQGTESGTIASTGTSTSDSEKWLSASTSASTSTRKYESEPYQPASSEKYVRDNALRLGYDNAEKPVFTCAIWKDDANVTVPTSMHNELASYRKELKEYDQMVRGFQPISDLRLQLALDESNRDAVCGQVTMDLEMLFPSRQLSKVGSSGFLEPLLPPFRQPEYCYSHIPKVLMDLSYLVHDFGAMCRKLKRTSRTVLVDMGASLDFHKGGTSPAVYLTELYRKFGFSFDHIYAYEVTPKEPASVFKKVPEHLMAAYHWINVGVETDLKSSLNPLKMILENFNEDDFIVVKLDIDTSFIEVPLANQLLTDTKLHGLVDQFYFEHHVMLGELADSWSASMKGSVRDSLELFIGLREAGVPAHSWV